MMNVVSRTKTRRCGRQTGLVFGLFTAVLLAWIGSAAAQQKESHLDRVVKSQKPRVCIWPEYYAISYKNPRTGQLEGIDIDIAKELAGELKAQLEFVESGF